MNDEITKGQVFDFLTVIEYYDNNKVICQCKCGKKVVKTLKELQDERVKQSCGCEITKRTLPNLYTLYCRFSNDEKNNWGSWDSFIEWSKTLRYDEYFSIRKPNRKLPYNKDNLEFGLYINSKFFTIKELNDRGYYYNKKKDKLVTFSRFKNKILDNDTFTNIINSQHSKHKKISNIQYKNFINKKQKRS